MILVMAARALSVDSSLATHLPLCGICEWRGPVVREKAKAWAIADRHRDDEHPELAAEAAKKRRQREAA